MRIRVGWVLEVCLRGVNDSLLFQMESEATAREAVLWFAANYMRKAPSDRGGAWLLAHSGQMTTITEAGVGSEVHRVAVAVIDPREVTAVSVDFVHTEEPESAA